MVDTGDHVADANYAELLKRREERRSEAVHVEERPLVDNPDPDAPCVQCGGRRVPGSRLCEECSDAGPREMSEEEVNNVISISSPLGASAVGLTEEGLRALYEKSLPSITVHYAREDAERVVPLLDSLKSSYHFDHSQSQFVVPGQLLVVNQRAQTRRMSIEDFELAYSDDDEEGGS